MNAVLKYPGAKWSLAQWIISRFPAHHSYLEPFFGSGAVLFNKSRSHIETVNDLDGDVVNFFRCIRDAPELLARAIKWGPRKADLQALWGEEEQRNERVFGKAGSEGYGACDDDRTPYAREEYDRAFDAQHTEADPIRQAVGFCVRMLQGHGFRLTGEKVGWKNDVQGRERAYAARAWTELPDVILQAAERLRGVQIERRPAAELIRRFNFPNVLIYCDPPYLRATRHMKRQYRHEMTDGDHLELLAALKDHRGPALVSGYPGELYDRELAGWSRAETTAVDQTSRVRREVLWMNFDPDRQVRWF